MVRIHSSLFYIILLIYGLAGGLFAALTPAWQAPDEPAHYNYVRYVAAQWRFPELVSSCYDQSYLDKLTARRFPPELTVDTICYEFHQPPLYYLLSASLFGASGGSLLALRLFSVLLGAGVVTLAFLIGRLIFPHSPAVAYGVMAFVAFLPMHVAILASVNNDALAELIFAILLLLLVRRLVPTGLDSTGTEARSTLRQDLLTGLILGIGLITKMTVYIALPLVAVALWLATPIGVRGRPWPPLFKQAGLIYGLALLIALPWYTRNVMLYGPVDMMGLARHDEVVIGQLRTGDYMAQVGLTTYLNNFVTTTFHSFWGQFGWMAVPMDQRTYQFLTVLTLVAGGGLIGFWRQGSLATGKLSALQQRALLLLGTAIVLMALAYGWYNLTFVQFQGRYLFPVLIPLGLFFAVGLNEALTPKWRWWLVTGLTVAFIWIIFVSVSRSGLDKWAALVLGLAVGLAIGRIVLARYWLAPTPWFVALCYAGLVILTLLTPFWFVLPYLVA